MLGFAKALTMRESGSSCRIVPKEVSVAPIRETPLRTGLSGKEARMGLSMLSPFWRSIIAV